MTDTKQVIVMRTDLGMRKGKMVAQGSHAAMAFMSRNLQKWDHSRFGDYNLSTAFTEAEREWLEHSFTKICVGVSSEAELLVVHSRAIRSGMKSYIITDNGTTEFRGVPTRTCCAIGPDYSEKFAEITGGLKLL
jgi:peptidyl-tRNA hydrolase, PTH2 family